ncbi:conserved Plasmodium protein, unknown function [Babesia microti strain RI]|uniref:Uncharacterized protein n=1 Tax=Babesia microti (strain RI) TaxID=1133968 RepID=I7J8E0_BABMR|nr:conserved Plasmodium protein, unknown function [Babesia microti strain RI]CCF72809.1 conserved Plasmodium protein, unknown function [Babesia microti strain RI]|eukprot:XP_012647418.1 conserved Plasmodium protein, unknown function [Babesia microti strain RI]
MMDRRGRSDICQMRPLRDCLKRNMDDIRKCIKEVEIFEKTCGEGVNYVHSREGLDDTRSGLFSGRRHL